MSQLPTTANPFGALSQGQGSNISGIGVGGVAGYAPTAVNGLQTQPGFNYGNTVQALPGVYQPGQQSPGAYTVGGGQVVGGQVPGGDTPTAQTGPGQSIASDTGQASTMTGNTTPGGNNPYGSNMGGQPQGYGGSPGTPQTPSTNQSQNQSSQGSQNWSQSQQTAANQAQAQNTSQSSTGIVSGMQDVYNQLLSLNAQHYGNAQSVYNSAQQNLASNLPSIYNGYNQVQSDVENTLGLGGALGGSNWGVAQPAETAIQNAALQQQGQNTQNMTNAGLGNTTAVANAADQINYQQQQATAGLGANLAQTAAGYQSQIGMAGLGAQMQGLGQQTGIATSNLPIANTQTALPSSSLTGQFSTGQGTSVSTGASQGTSASGGTSYGTSSGSSSGQGGVAPTQGSQPFDYGNIGTVPGANSTGATPGAGSGYGTTALTPDQMATGNIYGAQDDAMAFGMGIGS